MEKIKIITDTASDITIKQAKENNIELLPIHITIGNKTFDEEFEMPKKKFYKLLEEAEELPKTAGVSPEEYYKTFKRLTDEGFNRLIVVTINGSGSGTYNNANIAKDMYFEDFNNDVEIEIIDSKLYTYIYGRPVMLGAMMIKEGKSYREVLGFLKERLLKMRGYAYMSTLKYAKKSGRISLLSAIVGDALGLKPIIKIYDGKVEVIAKARGEKMALSKIAELLKEDAFEIRKNELIVVHGSNDKEQVEKATSYISEKLLPGSIFEGMLGCAITNNAGPETIGFLYIGK